MKKLPLLLLTFLTFEIFAQESVQLTHEAYDQLKSNGLIDPAVNYRFTDNQIMQTVHYSGNTVKNDVCDCLIQLDSTFTLAMLPNDDGSSQPIALPFTFDFYGNQYDTVIINNNGNVSFLAPYFTYTANPFPDSTYNMIAPFWGDVDTRGTDVLDSLGNYIETLDGGSVWYKVTPSALIVYWDHVGYFSNHTDLLSTFQLIISNGSDSLVPSGNNVSFCYGDMQWTTGDASMGVGGFGGSPATVGVNVGNGVDFFQVGQFDTTGVAFDGPYDTTDEVDFLDGQEIYFNVAGAAASNTPPVVVSSAICDTIDVYTGDTLIKALSEQFEFTVSVYAPEVGQGMSTQISCSAPAALTYNLVNSSTEFEQYNCVFNANSLIPGVYSVQVNVQDFGTPVASNSTTQYFRVNYDAAMGVNEQSLKARVYPNPTYDKLHLELEGLVSYVLYDLSGKTILSGAMTSGTLSLASCEAGTYLMHLMDETGKVSQLKVVKN
jgi:hypothetical protein